jgi:hypothetical protein
VCGFWRCGPRLCLQQLATATAPCAKADYWTTLQSAIGGNISKPITGETTYTLSCVDAAGATLTNTATVTILPTFQEL